MSDRPACIFHHRLLMMLSYTSFSRGRLNKLRVCLLCLTCIESALMISPCSLLPISIANLDLPVPVAPRITTKGGRTVFFRAFCMPRVVAAMTTLWSVVLRMRMAKEREESANRPFRSGIYKDMYVKILKTTLFWYKLHNHCTRHIQYKLHSTILHDIHVSEIMPIPGISTHHLL